MQDADGTLDIAVTGTLADEEVVVAPSREIRHGDGIQIMARRLADGKRQVLVFLGNVRIGTVRIARTEVVQAVAGAAHLVQVEQHVGHPVFIHRHQVAALRILGREPVAVGVHPVVVGPGGRRSLMVFTGLVVKEMMDARVGIDPGRETAHAVRVLGRDHEQHRIVQHPLHRRILHGRIMEHDGQQGLRPGDLVAVDRGTEIDHQRKCIQIELSGHGGVGHLQMRLPDLLKVLLVARRGDAYLQELPALEGIAEALDRDARRHAGQIIDIAGNVAPVGQAFVQFKPEEGLRRQNIRCILCILYGKIIHD